MPKYKRQTIFISILVLFAISCGLIYQSNPIVTPSITPIIVPTRTYIPLPTSTLEPTFMATQPSAILQTATLSPFCRYPPAIGVELADLPGPKTLHWQPIDASIGELWELNGLNTSIMWMDPSPTDGWWVMSLLVGESGMGGYYNALYVLDSLENKHWIASHYGLGGYYVEHQWLPDGRLLWIEDGEVFLASGDGLDRRGMDAPAQMSEIWLGANNVALVSGHGLWRLFLNTGKWEPVANAAGISGASGQLTMSLDGTFAAVTNSGQISMVPLQAGVPARQLITIDYPGRDNRISPPMPIPNSPYWLLPEVDFEGQPTQPMLLDTRDSSLHLLDKFLPGAGPLSLLGFSEDGLWVYARVLSTQNENYSNTSVYDWYVAPSNDLEAGMVVYTGDYNALIVGWETDPPALWLRASQDSEEVLRIPLPSGEPKTILDPAKLHPEDVRFLLEDVMIDYSDWAIPGNRVRALSGQGNTLGLLELPPLTVGYTRVRPSGPSRALIEMTNFEGGIDDDCRFEENLWL